MVYCQNVSQYIKIQNASYATIVTGFVVAVPALFLNLTLVTDLCSIGFICLCTGLCGSFSVTKQNRYSSWKIQNPYVNSKFASFNSNGLVFAFGYNKKALWILLLMKLKSIIQQILSPL
jgi:hypothetical protein